MAHSTDWITSFEALKSVYSDGAYSNMALNEAIPRHQGCRDSFVRNFVKGTIRQTITLDYIIGMLASGGLKGIRIRPLIILRMGLYALREMDSVPDHAAVNEAVTLARKTARGNDRFINAVLRSYIRRRDEFETHTAGPGADPDKSDASQNMADSEKADTEHLSGPRFIEEISDPVRRNSVRFSMPEDLVRLIMKQYGDEAQDILRGLNDPPDIAIRVNTLKTTRDQLIEELRSIGIDAAIADESDLAVICHGSGLIGSELYRKGLFTVQSLSSMLAVEALDPKPGSKVLDMCAAPGGKSTMMAELMDNKGSITACDIHEHRLRLIEASAERTGAEIITTRLSDGTIFDSSLENTFDYVLADVPCSGLGVMSTKPEIRMHTDTDSLKELTGIQSEILRNAFRYTRPGGRLCYSTCTLNKEENEEIINSFLSEIGKKGNTNGASQSSDGCFARIVEMRTVLPYNNLIGFYYCIIEKNPSAGQ